MSSALVLAGLSARMMAEAAVRDGHVALALDVFGDVDTRRVATRWTGIGTPEALRIDGTRFLAALEAFASHDGVIGWVAGSGFEDQPELLGAGAAILPLIGTPEPAVRRVRNPSIFFAQLDAQGIVHPEVRFEVPHAPGWLSKDAGASGGAHIRLAAAATPPEAGRYCQRLEAGTPMSALFVANGQRAAVLGFNELIVQSLGDRPFVYCGAVGPVALPPAVAAEFDAVVQALAATFALQGLCSLDVLLDGTRLSVLEINPRPSGSMALYGATMRAHVQACLAGSLDPMPRPRTVNGMQLVFARRARRAWRIDAAQVARLARRGGTHDLPAPGSVFAAGDPVCSVSASGVDARSVRAQLSTRCDAILNLLEPFDERLACA